MTIRTIERNPNVPTDFHFPLGATATAGAVAQDAIWSSSAYASLYPYLARLVTRVQWKHPSCEDDVAARKAAFAISLVTRPCRAMTRLWKSQYQADVLIVGESNRPSEIRMMTRLINGLAKRGMTVLYLVSFRSPEYKELATFVQEHVLQKQIRFLDPWQMDSFADKASWYLQSSHQAYLDWRAIRSTIPQDVHLSPGSYDTVLAATRTKVAWSFLEPRMRFDVVIVRDRWQPLSAAVAISCISSETMIVAFQHGVVTVPYPSVAARRVCFGSCSRELLINLEQNLAMTTGRPAFCQDFVLAGSLSDDLKLFPFHQRSSCLLVIDQVASWTGGFFGVSHEFDGLRLAVEEILARSKVPRRVIIRLHPGNRSISHWLDLARDYPDRVEFSHSALDLSFDLSRASVAVGLFSGALATAAACGVPTLFLWEPGWFYTPDLACFADDLFVSREDIVSRVETLLTDTEDYKQTREAALDAARSYYYGLQTCAFDQDFVDRIVRPL